MCILSVRILYSYRIGSATAPRYRHDHNKTELYVHRLYWMTRRPRHSLQIDSYLVHNQYFIFNQSYYKASMKLKQKRLFGTCEIAPRLSIVWLRDCDYNPNKYI